MSLGKVAPALNESLSSDLANSPAPQWLERAPALSLWLPQAVVELRQSAPGFFGRWVAPLVEACDLTCFLDRPADHPAETASLERSCRAFFQNFSLGISLTQRWQNCFTRQLKELNPRYAEMAGRSREDLLRAGDMRLLQTRLHDEETSAYMQAKVEFGIVYTGEASWLRPDGRRNAFEFRAAPLKLGEEIYVVGFDRDITN